MAQFLFDHQKRKRGFAVLMIVLVLAAAGLTMASSAAFLGLGSLESAYDFQNGEEALAIADSCMEESLERIRENSLYGIGQGIIVLAVFDGSCTISIIDSGGNQRVVETQGIFKEYHRRITANVAVSGNSVVMNSWQER